MRRELDPFDKNPPGAITDAQASELLGWFRAAADVLALRDWRLRVTTHEPERESIASSFIRDQADDAIFAVARDFFDRPERSRRQTLTHEILHLHFYRITRLAEKLVETELGTRTEAVISAAVGELEEQTIDRLAWAVAEWMPPAPGGDE